MDVSVQEARLRVLGLEEEDALSEHEQTDNEWDIEGRTVEGIEEEEEDTEDGLVVEEGILSGDRPELGCVFVVAEESPSFLLLLGTAQVKEVSCLCPYGDCNWLVRGRSDSWAFKESLAEMSSSVQLAGGNRRTFLIQGSNREFVAEALQMFQEQFNATTDTLLVVCSQRLRKQVAWSNWKISWSSLRHCEVGGVTDKSFNIGRCSSPSSPTSLADSVANTKSCS